MHERNKSHDQTFVQFMYKRRFTTVYIWRFPLMQYCRYGNHHNLDAAHLDASLSCQRKIFHVESQTAPFKFNTRYVVHTLKDTSFRYFKRYNLKEPISYFETARHVEDYLVDKRINRHTSQFVLQIMAAHKSRWSLLTWRSLAHPQQW